MDFSHRFGPKISQCETIIGYTFKSKLLCAEGLNAAADPQAVYTMHGFFKKMPKNDRLAIYGDAAADPQAVYTMHGFFKKMPKNDRLAIYGDAAAACHLCYLWVQRGLDKHCWTTLRHQIIGNENLGRVGMSFGLDACINANGGTVRITAGMVATALEAVLGAVERDGGHNALASVMDHLGLTCHALLSSVPSWLPRNYLLHGDLNAYTYWLFPPS